MDGYLGYQVYGYLGCEVDGYLGEFENEKVEVFVRDHLWWSGFIQGGGGGV